MRGALADTATWSSGIRTAAHTAPLRPFPGPRISKNQVSVVSAKVNASP